MCGRESVAQRRYFNFPSNLRDRLTLVTVMLPKWLRGKESACQCRLCSMCIYLCVYTHTHTHLPIYVVCVLTYVCVYIYIHFPGGSDDKESTYYVGDLGSIPGLGRFPGEGNDNPLQYSCLENSMDGGAWQATVHGVTKSRT